MGKHSILFCVRTLGTLLLLTTIAACGGGSGSDSGEADNERIDQATPRVSSLCGVYEDEAIVALPAGELEPVTVQVLNSDAVIITRTDGELAGQQQLIKLHGVTSDGVATLRVLNGIDVLERELATGAFFLSSGEGCDVTFPGGGAGMLGQLYSLGGESMNERMLMEGSVVPSGSDSCMGNELSQCYSTIGVTPRQPTAIELDVQEVSLTSACGAVREGAVENPALTAEVVRVEPVSTDLVVVTRLLGVEAGNSQLVKLHGLTSEGISATRLELGMNFIINAASGGAYLVTESQDCAVAVPDGGSGVAGQLYSMDGESINEELLANGYALTAERDACGGELLTGCYSEIEAIAPPEPPAPAPAPDHGESGEEGGNYVQGIIRDFLWKPVSESNGNVAVLVNPTDVRVVVTGAVQETLRNQGPSNGRGTTARGSRPGCAYGNNIVLQFFDASGQAIPIITGGTSITIANGCNRVEFRR
ncbi:MAG: hypothetical protein KDD69_14475 [Bdellovibrionales bacterium]|nr:hypothetical protein [Bdellovibrionales bacterium]